MLSPTKSVWIRCKPSFEITARIYEHCGSLDEKARQELLDRIFKDTKGDPRKDDSNR